MVLSQERGKARGKGDAALIVIPWSPFKGFRPGLKTFWREPDLTRRAADALFMITTPVIISTVPQIGLGIININPRDRQPEPKRNFPDSLPADNSGRK
jgi:hypothetical protein